MYQSSSYDYNLTAQLLTDGITETKLPRWVAVASSEQGELKKNEREWLLDHNWVTAVNLKGTGGWVQLELAGGDAPPEVDRVDIDARVRVGQASGLSPGWTVIVTGSDDGQTWTELGRASGADPSYHRIQAIDTAHRAVAQPVLSGRNGGSQCERMDGLRGGSLR